QDGPEPDRQVGCVQVAAVRRAVSLHLDGTTAQTIAHEIAAGEMNVERQVRPDEGKATGDLGLQSEAAVVQRTIVLGHALPYAIRRARVGYIRRALVGFGNLR